MNALHDKRKLKIGCLCMVATSLALMLTLYLALFYNPIHIIDRQHFNEAIANGFAANCDRLLARNGRETYNLPRSQWSEIIQKLNPRSVLVDLCEPKVVVISLWKNYREWEANTIWGIWMEHGTCHISLIVYAEPPTQRPPEIGNTIALVPYYMRKVADRVYLRYPKRMEELVLKRTDLIQEDWED